MKVKYTQQGNINCGLSALANALNDSSVLTDSRLAEAHKGQSIWLLNKYLEEDGKDYYIETLYKSIWSNSLPSEIDAVPGIDNSTDVLPLLMAVQFKEGGLNHLIALHVTIDGNINLMDSLQLDIVQTTWDNIRSLYPIIFGLYAFTPRDKDGVYCYLSNSQ